MIEHKVIKLSGYCKDLSGQRFGRLVALEPIGKDKHNQVMWKCRCDCGKECVVIGHSLICGNTRSCGCLQKEIVGTLKRTHGMSCSSTYLSWHNMIQRCENPKAINFQNYGGRGIKVCESWHKFENFLTDMGERPPGKTLDRIDNDGAYESGNCRWSTHHEQNMNQRDHKNQKWFQAWRPEQKRKFYLSNNQHQFAKDHGLDYRNISACLLGKRKSQKGWFFQRLLK